MGSDPDFAGPDFVADFGVDLLALTRASDGAKTSETLTFDGVAAIGFYNVNGFAVARVPGEAASEAANLLPISSSLVIVEVNDSGSVGVCVKGR